MNSLALQAQTQLILLEYGVSSAEDVIRWADDQIVAATADTDAELIELSTTASGQWAELVSHLRKLSSGCDYWQAFRAALPTIHDYLKKNPSQCENIAARMYWDGCTQLSSAPGDLNFVFRFGDELSLAKQGIYGDYEDVRRQFLQKLSECCVGSS